MINEQRLVDTFLDLVRIPSPSLKESQVAKYICDVISELGYLPHIDDAGEKLGGDSGNILLRIDANGGGSNLLLNAHIDTVETGNPAVKPILDDNTITSSGDTILGADDKTGVAVLLELLRVISEQEVKHGELLFCFTVAEENGLRGASVLDTSEYRRLDAGIVLDHGMPNEMVIGMPAKVVIDIEVNGYGGHAAFPESRVNAAHALCTAISRLPSGRLDAKSTCNIGIINSGDRCNVIPETATAKYEIRSHDNELLLYHLTNTLSTIESGVREARVYTGGDEDPICKATVDVEVNTSSEAFRLSVEAKPVVMLHDSISALGMRPETVIGQGISDASIFNANGLDTVVFGCGMHSVHNNSEYALVSEMVTSAKVLLEALGHK